MKILHRIFFLVLYYAASFCVTTLLMYLALMDNPHLIQSEWPTLSILLILLPLWHTSLFALEKGSFKPFFILPFLYTTFILSTVVFVYNIYFEHCYISLSVMIFMIVHSFLLTLPSTDDPIKSWGRELQWCSCTIWYPLVMGVSLREIVLILNHHSLYNLDKILFPLLTLFCFIFFLFCRFASTLRLTSVINEHSRYIVLCNRSLLRHSLFDHPTPYINKVAEQFFFPIPPLYSLEAYALTFPYFSLSALFRKDGLLPYSFIRHLSPELINHRFIFVYYKSYRESLSSESMMRLLEYRKSGASIVILEYNPNENLSIPEPVQTLRSQHILYQFYHDKTNYDKVLNQSLDILYADLSKVFIILQKIEQSLPKDDKYSVISSQLTQAVSSLNQSEMYYRLINITEYMAMYQAYYAMCRPSENFICNASALAMGDYVSICQTASLFSDRSAHELRAEIELIAHAMNQPLNRNSFTLLGQYHLFTALRNHYAHDTLIYFASNDLVIAMAKVLSHMIESFIQSSGTIEDDAVFVNTCWENPVPCFKFREGHRYFFLRAYDGSAQRKSKKIFTGKDILTVPKVNADLHSIEYVCFETGHHIHGDDTPFHDTL